MDLIEFRDILVIRYIHENYEKFVDIMNKKGEKLSSDGEELRFPFAMGEALCGIWLK